MNINISLSEQEYKKLKSEAYSRRESLETIVKEKVVPKKKKARKLTEAEVEKMLKALDKLAEENSKYTPKGFDSVKALREIRYGHE